MTNVPQPADQASDLIQKLSLESQTKKLEVQEATKKPAALPYVAGNGVATNGQIQSDRSTTPVLPDFIDPTMCYVSSGYPYYYGGFDGTMVDWEGVDMSNGVYGDNGSVVYNGYGYTPYPYSPATSPVPTMGNDGQLYGPQHYQYPAAYYQPQTPPPAGPYASNQAPAAPQNNSTSVDADKVPSSGEAANGTANGLTKGSAGANNNGVAPLRVAPNSSLNSNGSYGRYNYDGMRSAGPWSDGPVFADGKARPVTNGALSSTVPQTNGIQAGRNQNLRPIPNLMGLNSQRPAAGMGPTPGFMNRIYPNNRLYGQCGNNARTGFGSNGYDSRTNGRGWYTDDSKYKPRGRSYGYSGYGNENMGGLNELNRGPRARGFKNQKVLENVTLAVKGQPLSNGQEEKDNSTVTPKEEEYNRADFPEKYSEAKFFIIKSYSEDDVHKSIKYNVWASTPNGNKKLDAGYKDAQEKTGGCPVFLFFSVNTSGQFVGLAEMVGPVDFNKTVEYWQQDKWNGCFPVKWHVVKDVPNSLLKHITLENNDNKPVTNSRDTQEVKFEQGLQMIKIFKDHLSKTSILDDFVFYETRQKTMQEKRAKQQFQKQVWGSKTANTDTAVASEAKDGENGTVILQKPFDVSSTLVLESTADGESKQSEVNGSVAGSVDEPKGTTEKRVLSNGNGVLSNGNGVVNGH